MSDIVKELRFCEENMDINCANCKYDEAYEDGCVQALVRKAADEIVRLRDLIPICETVKEDGLFMQINKLEAELESERKKHTANENKCGNCYFFIPNVGLINRNEHTKDGTCGRHAYEKVFCGKEDYCSWWLSIPPKGEKE